MGMVQPKAHYAILQKHLNAVRALGQAFAAATAGGRLHTFALDAREDLLGNLSDQVALFADLNHGSPEKLVIVER
jgi:hypothetical protein